MTIHKNIEILEDGKNNWSEKKEMSIALSDSFLRISRNNDNDIVSEYYHKKYIAISQCSNYLTFKQLENGSKKLIDARFCRLRLCPMCTWRRTKKTFSQVSKIIQEINKDKEREYIFLTLTCKNVDGSDLKQQIKDLLQAFKKMMDGSSRIKKICKGYFRALEVTRNSNGTYHPHIHIIICVNKSYFTDKTYIKTKEWATIWQHYLNVTYTPVVYIEKATGTYKSIAELSKYSVKMKDIILDSDEKTDANVIVLQQALHRVRLIGMGGLFKEYHKKLNLDDITKDDVDLINTDAETTDESLATEILLKFKWTVGYNNYMLEKK